MDPLVGQGDRCTGWVWLILVQPEGCKEWDVVDAVPLEMAPVTAEQAMEDAVAALLALGLVMAHDLARMANGERLW